MTRHREIPMKVTISEGNAAEFRARQQAFIAAVEAGDAQVQFGGGPQLPYGRDWTYEPRYTPAPQEPWHRRLVDWIAGRLGYHRADECGGDE